MFFILVLQLFFVSYLADEFIADHVIGDSSLQPIDSGSSRKYATSGAFCNYAICPADKATHTADITTHTTDIAAHSAYIATLSTYDGAYSDKFTIDSAYIASSAKVTPSVEVTPSIEDTPSA